jgi:hypothetical protein
MAKKQEEHIEPVVSSIPVPQSDSPLVIDLPDGQKLVVGNLPNGSVIEVATWRGTGRPDSRTQRLMLGVSGNEPTNVKKSSEADSDSSGAADGSHDSHSQAAQSSSKSGRFDVILVPLFRLALPIVNAFLPRHKQIRIAPSAPKNKQQRQVPPAQKNQTQQVSAVDGTPAPKKAVEVQPVQLQSVEPRPVEAQESYSHATHDEPVGKKYKFTPQLKASKKNQKNLDQVSNESVYQESAPAAAKFSFKVPKIKALSSGTRNEENVEDWLDRLIAENNVKAESARAKSTSVKVMKSSASPSKSSASAKKRSATSSTRSTSSSRASSAKKKATSTKSASKSVKSRNSSSSRVKKATKKR